MSNQELAAAMVRIRKAEAILKELKSQIDGHFPTRVDPWVPWNEVKKALEALEGK